jgi:hypothetical protein
MPIKEIINFALGIVLSIALLGGPQNLRSNLRDVQIKILREMTRVDNWGNPSPWAHHSHLSTYKTKDR